MSHAYFTAMNWSAKGAEHSTENFLSLGFRLFSRVVLGIAVLLWLCLPIGKLSFVAVLIPIHAPLAALGEGDGVFH
jgi:hypothetical protein